MEIRDSSEYVIERAKRLNAFFKNIGWTVTAGKNNCILIYIASDRPYQYTPDQFAEIIGESDYHVEATGLKLSSVTYIFYHRGEKLQEIEELPGKEFDVWDD